MQVCLTLLHALCSSVVQKKKRKKESEESYIYRTTCTIFIFLSDFCLVFNIRYLFLVKDPNVTGKDPFCGGIVHRTSFSKHGKLFCPSLSLCLNTHFQIQHFRAVTGAMHRSFQNISIGPHLLYLPGGSATALFAAQQTGQVMVWIRLMLLKHEAHKARGLTQSTCTYACTPPKGVPYRAGRERHERFCKNM